MARGGKTNTNNAGGGLGATRTQPPSPPLLLQAPPELSWKRGLTVDAVGENAWVVRGVLSQHEAAALASAADAHGYEQATSRGPRYGEAHRNHGRLVGRCSFTPGWKQTTPRVLSTLDTVI